MTYYNAQCCGFAVEYQSFNFSGLSTRPGARRTSRFNFTFTLAGIGTFSNSSAPSAARAAPATGTRLLDQGTRYMIEVLVTGGAGFIGSNFVRHALAAHRRLARHDARQADLRRAASRTCTT